MKLTKEVLPPQRIFDPSQECQEEQAMPAPTPAVIKICVVLMVIFSLIKLTAVLTVAL